MANSPEFRDVVDDQFKEAVLDPEEDVAGDSLVLCCESCGAPSKFRCSICDRLVCAFCTLKQHAFDGIPPHYPSRYSPRFRREIESDGRWPSSVVFFRRRWRRPSLSISRRKRGL